MSPRLLWILKEVLTWIVAIAVAVVIAWAMAVLMIAFVVEVLL